MRYSTLGMGVLLIASLLLAVGVAFAADDAAAKDTPMSILPAPKAVTIDGDLKDWDTSGKIGPFSFDDEAFDEYHATFYAMYDKDNLYLAAEIVEPHLPFNSYPGKGVGAWDGDDVIIRVTTIPKDAANTPIDNVDTSRELWNGNFYWNNNEKVVYWDGYYGAYGKFLYKKELPGFAAAMTPAKDGHGYTMEIKMPWAVLNATAPRPKPGDAITLVYEISLASDSAAEPHRIFQIYGNAGGGSPSKAIFK